MGRVFEAFFYNERSSLDLGLKIEGKSILNGPEPDLQEYEIPGRDGKVYLSNRRRRSVEVSYDTFLKVPRPEDKQGYVTAIKGWLLGNPGEYLRLEDTYDLEHFRRAAYTAGLDFIDEWDLFTKQTITFSCLPYRYLKTGEQSIPAESGTVSAYNPTAFEALPKLGFALGFQFSGGAITFQVVSSAGEYTGTLRGIPAKYAGLQVVVDSDSKTVGVLMPDFTVIPTAQLESFPVFRPGENQVSVTGGSGVSLACAVPMWREL